MMILIIDCIMIGSVLSLLALLCQKGEKLCELCSPYGLKTVSWLVMFYIVIITCLFNQDFLPKEIFVNQDSNIS